MNKDAHTILLNIRDIHLFYVPAALEQATGLLNLLPIESNNFKALLTHSLRQRIFTLMRDSLQSFTSNPEGGYFTTSVLTRLIMETGSVIILMSRDNTDQFLSDYLQDAQTYSKSRLHDLNRMISCLDLDVATAALNETGQAQNIINALDALRQQQTLPPPRKYPKMLERCRRISKKWEFFYHATYRELSENAHGQLTKIMHPLGLALASSNQGEALFYEHSRAMNYAFMFWGSTMVEVLEGHISDKELDPFKELYSTALQTASEAAESFNPDNLAHSFRV